MHPIRASVAGGGGEPGQAEFGCKDRSGVLRRRGLSYCSVPTSETGEPLSTVPSGTEIHAPGLNTEPGHSTPARSRKEIAEIDKSLWRLPELRSFAPPNGRGWASQYEHRQHRHWPA